MGSDRRRMRLPVFDWLPGYDRANLKGDLVAGLTVGAMLIPQSMGYALLAGLPPQIGLYSAVLPLIAYAAIGCSRQLGVGPTAISSLLTAAGLAHLSRGDPTLAVELAATLAVVVGLMRIALGVGRLGFMVSFLSRPVLSGFTSAAAILIGASQLKHLVGIKLEHTERVHQIVAEAATRIDEVQGATLAIGIGAIALLAALRRWLPSWPGALIAVGLATLAVTALQLEDHHVSVVGEIPGRLPQVGVPTAGLDHLGDMVPTALAITMLGFVESIAIAKVFAQRHRYPINPNRELVALGVSTAVAGLSNGYPVSGSFSRTAVNATSGARTQLAGVLSAGVVALTLVVLTPLFRPLPHAVLASVVVMAVAGLVDVRRGPPAVDGQAQRLLAAGPGLRRDARLRRGTRPRHQRRRVTGRGAAPDHPAPHRRPRPDPGHDPVPQRRTVAVGRHHRRRRGRPRRRSAVLRQPRLSPGETHAAWRRSRTAGCGCSSSTPPASPSSTRRPIPPWSRSPRISGGVTCSSTWPVSRDACSTSCAGRAPMRSLGPDHFFLSADDAVRHAEEILDVQPELDLADEGEILIEETPWRPT